MSLKQAHEAAKKNVGDLDSSSELARIEADVDRQVAKLWNLNDKELGQIQRSLMVLPE